MTSTTNNSIPATASHMQMFELLGDGAVDIQASSGGRGQLAGVVAKEHASLGRTLADLLWYTGQAPHSWHVPAQQF
jgi:hypothetical protein